MGTWGWKWRAVGEEVWGWPGVGRECGEARGPCFFRVESRNVDVARKESVGEARGAEEAGGGGSGGHGGGLLYI